jgi:hypothetical protein
MTSHDSSCDFTFNYKEWHHMVHMHHDHLTYPSLQITKVIVKLPIKLQNHHQRFWKKGHLEHKSIDMFPSPKTKTYFVMFPWGTPLTKTHMYRTWTTAKRIWDEKQADWEHIKEQLRNRLGINKEQTSPSPLFPKCSCRHNFFNVKTQK